jgi:broad-specificity NMP kinase
VKEGMQKKLIIVNGTMGVGKTSICKELLKKTTRAVWLDGDWCWMMNPWLVNEENKQMVLANIVYLLRNFLNNSTYDYVIFNWVIHQPEIFDMILDRLNDLKFELFKITLLCSEEILRARSIKDNRDLETIEISMQRLKLYEAMETIKVDTTNLTIPEVVGRIQTIID